MLFNYEEMESYGISQENFEQFKDNTQGWITFVLNCNEDAVLELYDLIGIQEYNTYMYDGTKEIMEKRLMQKCELFLTATFMYKAKEEYLADNTESQSMNGRSITKSKYNKQAYRYYFKAMHILLQLGYDILSTRANDTNTMNTLRILQ